MREEQSSADLLWLGEWVVRGVRGVRGVVSFCQSVMDLSRLQKEIQEIKHDKASGISVRPVGDNLTTLQGQIAGPKDTPYEGGKFVVDIQIKGVYPFEPPKMRFKTKIW